MPRGSKICEFCGAHNGPRSWQCSSCGKGFVVKGVRKPDVDVDDKPKQSRLVKPYEKAKTRLLSLVEKYEGDDDKVRRQKYNIAGETWQSLDGRFRIVEQRTFMGVNVGEHFEKSFYLMIKEGDRFELVRRPYRFSKLVKAVKAMQRYEVKTKADSN